MSLKSSKCQALGWLCTLYTGLAKNIKFEIFGCQEALEGCKGRTFLYRHFEFRREIWKNIGPPDV